MRSKIFILAAVVMLTLSFSDAYSQYYCFFVDNKSGQPFYELKIRPTGTKTFSDDLLPKDLIESGKHFWIRTGDDAQKNYDVQITDLDGKPLQFTWKDVSGNMHNDKPFITLNVMKLHTLLITTDDDDDLTFKIYNDDRFEYGDPCPE